MSCPNRKGQIFLATSNTIVLNRRLQISHKTFIWWIFLRHAECFKRVPLPPAEIKEIQIYIHHFGDKCFFPHCGARFKSWTGHWATHNAWINYRRMTCHGFIRILALVLASVAAQSELNIYNCLTFQTCNIVYDLCVYRLCSIFGLVFGVHSWSW